MNLMKYLFGGVRQQRDVHCRPTTQPVGQSAPLPPQPLVRRAKSCRYQECRCGYGLADLPTIAFAMMLDQESFDGEQGLRRRCMTVPIAEVPKDCTDTFMEAP